MMPSSPAPQTAKSNTIASAHMCRMPRAWQRWSLYNMSPRAGNLHLKMQGSIAHPRRRLNRWQLSRAPSSLPLRTRKLPWHSRENCNQPTDGVYADLEFQNAVSDCIIDQTVTLPALQQKYGPSPKTIQSGLTKVLAYITHGAQVLE